MKFRSLLFCFFLFSINAFSQDIVVRDLESNTVIPNVTVLHLSSNTINYSDEKGEVFLKGYEEGEDLLLSCLGYYDLALLSKDFSLGNSLTVYLIKQVVPMPEAVVVTAFAGEEQRSEIPKQVELINAPQIKFLNPQTSADVLQTTGMVLVQKSQAGGGSPIVRGFEANKVLLMVDGVRLNNAIYRSGHLQNAITIDPLILEKAEMIFGPASVMFGSDALGGVIHYRTKTPQFAKGTDQEVGGTLFGRIASAAQERTMHVDLSVAEGNWASLTSISFSSFEDLRMGSNRWHGDEHWGLVNNYVLRENGEDVLLENPEPEVQKGTGYSQLDFLQKFRIKLGENWILTNNFQLSTSSLIPRFDNLNDTRNGAPRWAEWNYGPQTRTLFSISAEQKKKTKYYDGLSIRLAHQFIEESRYKRLLFSDLRNEQVEKVNVWSAQVDFVKHFAEGHRLNYGFDFNHNGVKSSAVDNNLVTRAQASAPTRYPNDGSNMSTFGMYLAWKKNLSEKIKLDFGARYSHALLESNYTLNGDINLPFDQIQFNNGAFTGSAGLIYDQSNTWSWSAVLATAYRIPNVDDFAKVRENGGFVTVPNDQLTPEYVYSAELSTRKLLFDRQAQIEAGGFYSIITDAIVPRPSSLNGQDSLFVDGENVRIESNVNAGEAFIYGAFLSFQAQLFDAWRASGSFNYTYGQSKSDDAPLGHIPPIFGRLGLIYSAHKFRGEMYAFYNGRKPIERYAPGGTDKPDEALENGTPAWWTLNLATSYHISSSLEAQVGLENILDVHYKTFASGPSAPGRNLYLTLRASF